MSRSLDRIVLACLLGPGLVVALAADDPAASRAAEQAALKPLGDLVGAWRGVGQPQRSSTKGAWKETADWSWKLGEGSASLVLKLDGDKYIDSIALRPSTARAGEFDAEAVLKDGGHRTFSGKLNDKKQLVVNAENVKGESPSRLTLSPLHETRFLLLLEAPDGPKGFKRLGEIGYTREGVAFAAGDSAPVCIVTEGRGTMAVKYKGETYYVCCSGCKELFEDNPESVLAEAKARREKAGKK